MHLVRAWVQAHRLVLAQTTVADRSNEIAAILPLLRLLGLQGAMWTPDRMGATWPVSCGPKPNAAAETGSPTEVRCSISRVPPKARPLRHAVCRHGSIENSHHGVLDVAFHEDDSRIRTGQVAHHRAILKRIAHNLLPHNQSLQVGTARKRLSDWPRLGIRTVCAV